MKPHKRPLTKEDHERSIKEKHNYNKFVKTTIIERRKQININKKGK